MSCARVWADAREAAGLAANLREVLAAAVPALGEERDSAACPLAAPASAAVPRAGVLLALAGVLQAVALVVVTRAGDLQAVALLVETRAGVSAAGDPALAVLLLTGEGAALAAVETRAVVLAASPLKGAMKVVLPTILVVGFQEALVDPADFPAAPVQALAQVEPLDQIGRLGVPKPGQPPAVASTLE